MRSHQPIFSFVLGALVCSAAAGAARAQRAASDDTPGPPLEVVGGGEALALPAIPGFELPPLDPALRSPRELRVRRELWLGAQVRVRGYVTWRYDCASELARQRPKLSRAKLAKLMRQRPELCGRPKLALGDRAASPLSESLLVVEVPPSPAAGRREAAPAPLAVGQYVEIAGRFAQTSERGEADPAGLLVFASAEPASPPDGAPPQSPASDDPVVIAPRPPSPAIEAKSKNASQVSLAACTRAFAQGQHAAALTSCGQAIGSWQGNHMAWYVRASAHMALGDWPAARGDVARAAALRPDQAMYHLYHGVALYEEALATARATAAAPSPATRPDVAALVAARAALRRAAAQAPALWRAHVYLARIAGELGREREQAEALGAAIRAHPRYAFSYAALVELYRRWGHLEQALAVARLGAQTVAPNDAPPLWLSLAAIEEQRGDLGRALEAYDSALAKDPQNARALLGRGRSRLARNDRVGATADLRALLQLASTDEALRRAATELLQAADGK